MTADSADLRVIAHAADTVTTRLNAVRHCSACKQTKPLNQFGILRRDPSGHRGTCKRCVNERQRLRRSTPEGKRENVAAWYKSNARALREATGVPTFRA